MTTRKRPTQTLGIASLAWAVFLALVMLSVQTVAQASPLDEAIPEMRRYCMEEVCFGMTVDEVSSLPHRGFALQNRLDEAMQCLESSFRTYGAAYTAKAGTKLSVHFIRYPGPGSSRSQYRVWSISQPKATEAELDVLRGTLIKRYGLVQSDDERMWWRLSSPLNVMLIALRSNGAGSILDLGMQATGPLADWLSSQPECQERQSPSATPMQAKAVTLEESLQGMQAYCMSDVCLGMTADDVEKLAGTKLRMWEQFPDKRNCKGDGQHTSATFTDRSGQEFNLTFRDYPGPTDPRMRYRLTSVALYVQASEPEFDGLRKTLTSRYALAPSNLWKRADHLDEWSKKASVGSVFVQSSYQRKNALLILGQFDPDYAGRFADQEECKSRLPKI